MSIRNDYILHAKRLKDKATPMSSEVRQQTVLGKGTFVFDTDLKIPFVGDGETVGGIPLAVQSSENAYVYGVDVDNYSSTTSRTKVILNHSYDYAGANTALRYHAVDSFAQTPAHAFHAVLRDLERGVDVCSLDISDYTRKSDGTALSEQEKRGFWVEGGQKYLVDFMERWPKFYYRIDHYDVTVSEVVHHHTVKLVSHEPFIGAAIHPFFYDGGSILVMSDDTVLERMATHDNGTTGYAWKTGATKYYTASPTPQVGDTIYTNSAASTDSGKTVAAFYAGGSTASDQYVALYKGVLCDADGIPKEQSADGTQVSRAATDRFRSIQGYRPSTNVTQPNFRINAANNNAHLASLQFREALELLVEIDAGNMNSQAAISEGLVNCSSFLYAEVRKTGRSARFGNSTVTYSGGTAIKPEILADEEVSTITVGDTVYTRDVTADDGGKAWVHESETIYTKFEVPTVYVAASGSGATAIPAFGDKAYTDKTLTTEKGSITNVTGLDYDFLHMGTGGTSIWRANTAHVVSFSWRGLENIWGEIWEFVDGSQKFQANDKDTITLSDNSVWYRYWAGNNGSTAYAWKNGTDILYTASEAPAANAVVYTASDKSATDARTVSAYTVDFTDSGYWCTNDYDLYLKLDSNKGAGQYGEVFPTRGYTGDSIAWVSHPFPKASNYIKTYDEFTYLAITVGGSATTYHGDYIYNNAAPGACVLLVGGHAINAAYAGVGYFSVGSGLGYALATIGARLTARADEGTANAAARAQRAQGSEAA